MGTGSRLTPIQFSLPFYRLRLTPARVCGPATLNREEVRLTRVLNLAGRVINNNSPLCKNPLDTTTIATYIVRTTKLALSE